MLPWISSSAVDLSETKEETEKL